MARTISPLAVIDPQAKIGEDVQIGPFCVVGAHVVLGAGTRLANNVTVIGHTTLGEDNILFPNVVIGADPQDISYKGDPTRIEIGHHNYFREGVTVNRATTKETGLTKIGNHNYFMANCHVAHDCVIGDHVILANGALLGGHTHVHNRAIISGNVGVHHWVTIGDSSFIGGMSRIVHDVPPYMLVEGHPSIVRCVNIVGLKRQGFTSEEISSLSESHRLIYRAKMGLEHAREILQSHSHLNPQVEHLLDFIDQQRKGSHGRQRDGGRKTLGATGSTKTAA
jgi:UDP-N-acetylglucosamine acyltransferase